VRSEFTGCILEVRAVEDCIRATRKYTKGAFTRPAKHPIQGEEFPSGALSEFYEVYPEMELSWEMPASDAWAWVWGDTPHIDVRFLYNYQSNKGKVVVYGNDGVVGMLREGIPNFARALTKLTFDNGGNSGRKNKAAH